VLGIVCLTLQSYITENKAATLSELLYSAMFNDSPFTVELAESYNVGAFTRLIPILRRGVQTLILRQCVESQIKLMKDLLN
jgi:hypothetical protein